ncbi:MAG: hypothetical protein A2086_08145 [Spirochaetes bacterium GWD1_27_9]|nr:MAG: hypothetical protein A2Z98_16295 [Spirochaetes bacterium GWB1_27_13]OHD34491.1 MAG: hypothetical protein A2086_08145 [Spirochaetes bacterium GWD1_27_9]
MTVAELRNSINKGKIENIYLLAGPEVGEKNEILSLIEKKIFGSEEPTKYTFYIGNEFELEELNDTVSANLLFSTKKLIIIKNIELVNKTIIKSIENFVIPKKLRDFDNKLNEEKRKLILSYYKADGTDYILKESLKEADIKKLTSLCYEAGIKGIDDSTYLIMLNETTDKIPAGLTNLLTQNQNIIFWEMFDNQKPQWIRAEFKKHNLFIDDDAIQFIINTVENNKQQLEGEIQKIATSFDSLKKVDKNVVTKEIIEEFLYHSKDESPFTLYSAILEKKMGHALDILEKVFYTDEDGILGGLLYSHRRFLKTLDLYENQNKNPDEIFSAMFITLKRAKDEFNAGFKNYSFTEASFAFYYLSELDYYLKILPSELKLVKLQEFIVNYIAGNTGNSFLQGDLQYFQI